jgi:hypothetical protein
MPSTNGGSSARWRINKRAPISKRSCYLDILIGTMLPNWFWKPENLFQVALWAIGILLSGLLAAFPAAVRRFALMPGRKLSQWSVGRLEWELQTLEKLNGDAYQLILWIAALVLDILKSVLYLLFGLLFLELLGAFFFHRPLIPINLIIPLGIIGPVVGRGAFAYEILGGLRSYEERVSQLNKTLADWKEQGLNRSA